MTDDQKLIDVFFKAAIQKIKDVQANDKADGSIDLGKLYSDGCVQDL